MIIGGFLGLPATAWTVLMPVILLTLVVLTIGNYDSSGTGFNLTSTTTFTPTLSGTKRIAHRRGSVSQFQQKTTGLPAQGLASTISNFCCGSYRLPRVPEGGLPAEVRVRHPWEARLVRVV